ncbi:gamma-glutamyltransferase [Hasllibacter sp. MH4015]|uniref:gamma-glutamyltransferase n=1 Tax=Hasllibacter sp. MH4015 TaxID=2854029 RepID=UPI001CD76E48|nr:gamma-glutamyltransferase [Hasllibacter sp. MH4015]
MRAALPLLLAALFVPLHALAQQTADTVAPEAATATGTLVLSDRAQAALDARNAGDPVVAQDWMVVAANPLAVEAGADVLAAGGTAADAMVAVQAVLGLVEPQSSGLGGGAFLVWFDAETGALTTLDGRETAPLAVTPTLFQNDSGEPLGFWDAVVGGLSVGTPGTPRLMEEAHRRWGQANWGDLLDPAITLAEDGFNVSPRLAGAIANDADRLGTFPATAAYFLPDGAPLSEGALLQNVAYAETLREMQRRGADAIYHGPIAEGIVATVRDAEGNPGLLSLRDLAVYEVIERPAVCAVYRGMDVCGMGPPSSGALTVGQILGIVDNFALDDPTNADEWRLIGDASRLAFADRGRYMADSDYVPMPTEGLVDPSYLEERAQLIEGDRLDPGMALPEVAPGNPAWDHAQLWGDDQSLEFPSTSHISIVDSYGNVLSMTTTIENGFGSRLMAPGGFLLNNELTDFSFRTHSDGLPIANRVEPGKRPRSSMSPTIVMQDGAPIMAIGSPGGSRIIGYVATTLIAHYDWGLDIQDAIALPHAVNRFGTYDLEEGTEAEALAPELEAMGYEVNIRGLNSGLHAIAITPDGLMGGADPRREGIALGQ